MTSTFFFFVCKIAGNGLEGTIPSHIGEFTSATELELSGNRLVCLLKKYDNLFCNMIVSSSFWSFRKTKTKKKGALILFFSFFQKHDGQ